MEGWLSYRSGSDKADGWKHRYCYLNEGKMRMYKDKEHKEEEKALVLIPLEQTMIELVPPDDIHRFQFALLPLLDEEGDRVKISKAQYKKKKSFVSRLVFGSKKDTTHFFSVYSEIDMQLWIKNLTYASATTLMDDSESRLAIEGGPVLGIAPPPPIIEEEEMSPEEIAEKQRNASLIIQNAWRMKQARILFLDLRKRSRAIKLLSRFLQRSVVTKKYKPIRKQHRYRVNVLREFLSTEKSYLEGLQLLVSIFLEPLREKKYISAPQVSSIFSNIESIVGLHKYLYTELLNLLPSEIPPYGSIGPLITFLLPQFKLYVAYINNYDSAVKLLFRLEESSSKFHNFVETANQTPELNTKPLPSFLIMPVQRLPRIEMLLKDLLKHTDELHPDHVSLTRAFAGISELTSFVNERKREEENVNKMAAVQRKMGRKGTAHSIVQPHRKWLREGPLLVIRDKKKINRSVILFSDMLLCSTEKSIYALKKGLHTTVRYETLETYQLDAKSSVTPWDGRPNSFLLQTRHSKCVLCADSEQCATDWITAIEKSIQMLRNPISFLSQTQ